MWEVRFTFTHVCGPNGGTALCQDWGASRSQCSKISNSLRSWVSDLALQMSLPQVVCWQQKLAAWLKKNAERCEWTKWTFWSAKTWLFATPMTARSMSSVSNSKRIQPSDLGHVVSYPIRHPCLIQSRRSPWIFVSHHLRTAEVLQRVDFWSAALCEAQYWCLWGRIHHSQWPRRWVTWVERVMELGAQVWDIRVLGRSGSSGELGCSDPPELVISKQLPSRLGILVKFFWRNIWPNGLFCHPLPI